MKKQVVYLLAVIAVAVTAFLIGCQKETSFEGSNNPAKGSLQSAVSGDCLPKSVNGIYEATVALVPATNTITVQVNVTQTGTYVVTTDTINGVFFRAVGTFTTLGPTTVILRGNGTPFAAGTSSFVVSFDGTVCDIDVTVVPAGTGAAVLSLSGGGTGTPPPSCSGATTVGTYTAGTPLTGSNQVIINVTVATAGTYNITTGPVAVNGMIFSGSGTVASGAQTITLTGTGTPSVAGTTTIPITVGTTACSFTVNVVAPAGAANFTMNCGTATANGTYSAGTILNATNTITIPITLITPGTYSITTAPAVNGMIFSNSGTLSAGTTSITLNGAGTPGSAGATSISAGTCTITVNVVAGSGNAIYTADCPNVIVNGPFQVGVAPTAANTIVIPVTVTQAGTYSFNVSVDGMVFTASGSLPLGAGTITLNPNTTFAPTAAGTFTPSIAGCNVQVTVLSNDYFPRTTNSNWSYEFDDNSDPTDTLLRKALSNTITAPAGGNAFTIFMANDGSGFDSSGYYRRSGGDYFEWFNWANYLNGITAPAWAEYIMLKDNVANNTNWKTGATQVTTASGTIYLRFSYTIKQKDVTLAVTTSLGTVTYQNVIQVEERIEGSPNGVTWQDLSGASSLDFHGESYYARGVGLILFEAFDDSNAPLFKQELRRRVVF